MGKKYTEEWNKRLKLKRFRDTEVKGVVIGWNPFDSDLSRITMSAPFRRLQDKAQVFPLEPNDFVRTRLTHSIEVSSVARSIGVRVENELVKIGHLSREKIGHIPSILASAGLAHDIGNPPFGHFGEDCIKTFFKGHEVDFLSGLNSLERADLLNFDGNVQGLRSLLKLGLSKDEFSYNLTFPTLATIVKYPKDSITGNKGKEKSISFKKYGYYQADADKYKTIDEALGLLNERHPLCYLLEAADDICYSASDVEDGFKKHTINLEFLTDTLNDDFSTDDECKKLLEKINLLEKEFKDFGNKNSLIAQECRIFAQIKMINSVVDSFCGNHESIIHGRYDKELFVNSSSEELRRFFDVIARYNFSHRDVITNELLGQSVISYLMEKFTKAVLSPDKEKSNTLDGKLYSLISSQPKFVRKQPSIQHTNYLNLLMVVDYISGMTDSYALKMYRDLCGM